MTIKSTLPLLLALGLAPVVATASAAPAINSDSTVATRAPLRSTDRILVAESQSGVSSSVAADFEVRIQRLERTIEELTGKLEKSAYDVQQLQDRVERMNGDNDFRFQALEKGAGGAVGGAPVAPAKPGAGTTTRSPIADDAPVIGQPTRPTAPTRPEVAPPTASGSLKLPGDKPAAAPAPAAAPPAPTGDAQTDYDRAYNLLRSEDWEKAEKAFADFIKRNPKSPLAGNAQYWMGQTFYIRKKFNEAAVAFAEGFKSYPTNNKAADNLLALGLSLSELGKSKEACTAYEQLNVRFPGAAPAIKRRAEAERKKLACR